MLDYEMALKLNSRYGLAYFNMGNVYFHHRQFQQVTYLLSTKFYMWNQCMYVLELYRYDFLPIFR